ncbi:MAG: bifunctional 3-(3-hydroxy-phenyl)propionate/3-hydroxycinnamic acid hydroxylase [Candidatus Binatia bacterium]
MTAPRTHDVVIVGCGPVGAGAAILLARAGLRVVIVDRSLAVYELPRAVFLDGETVRAFQRIGLGEEIARLLQPWRAGEAAYFTDSKRNAHFGVEMPRYGVNGWRDGAFFDQPEFEARLRELMALEPNVEALLGHEVTSIGQDAQEVTVTATDLATGQVRELRSRYAVACDGASSFVRRSLGIAWHSLGYDHDWLVVDIVAKDPADLPSVTMQVCDPARLVTYICGKDPFRRWEFRLLPGETREEMMSPARVEQLLSRWIPASRYVLRRSAVYQFHAATAERWRDGRIFLAGDAAHQTPPFLGQGLNAGFRDVVNLAWKIQMVASGAAPESLLDSYEEERDPHAHELVDWAVAVGRLMDAMADAEAGRALGPPPDDLMRSGYGQGRTTPPLRRGLVTTEQVSDLGVTGYLFNQPTVAAQGGPLMFDEILGPGFAVVGRDASALAMSKESAGRLESLGARIVDISAYELVAGCWDRLFAAHGAAIVRPDRYVFGVTDETHSLDALVLSLEQMLSRGADAAAGNGNGHDPLGHPATNT